jgi:hypothetical protein
MSRNRDNWEYRIDEHGDVELTVRTTREDGHVEEAWAWLGWADVKLMFDLASEERRKSTTQHDTAHGEPETHE